MQYEFAPLEGITGYIYRNAHHACFPSMDRYYTPFITPKKGKSFTTREWNDIAAEHNQNIAVVPQILANQAEGFCKVAGMLKEQGYEEVNLNLGCPSATVTAKKKGAGFLADPDALDAFLEEIFAHSPLKISIKTRIGVENPDEFELAPVWLVARYRPPIFPYGSPAAVFLGHDGPECVCGADRHSPVSPLGAMCAHEH